MMLFFLAVFEHLTEADFRRTRDILPSLLRQAAASSLRPSPRGGQDIGGAYVC